jgi:hypothetical protein
MLQKSSHTPRKTMTASVLSRKKRIASSLHKLIKEERKMLTDLEIMEKMLMETALAVHVRPPRGLDGHLQNTPTPRPDRSQ